MKESERCQHPDCIYRNHNDPEASGRCHYWMITGHCRIVGLPKWQQLPCNCPKYQPDGTAPKKQDAWSEQAMKIYEAGGPDRVIARAVGKHVDTIRKWRRQHNLPIHRDTMGPAQQFDWKAAEALYKRGKNDREIADALGCGISSVTRWRYKHELLPNAHRFRKERKS